MSWDFLLGLVAMVVFLIALIAAAVFLLFDRKAPDLMRVLAGVAIFDSLVFLAVLVAEPLLRPHLQGEGSEGVAWGLLGILIVSGAIALFLCGPILLLYLLRRWWRR